MILLLCSSAAVQGKHYSTCFGLLQVFSMLSEGGCVISCDTIESICDTMQLCMNVRSMFSKDNLGFIAL